VEFLGFCLAHGDRDGEMEDDLVTIHVRFAPDGSVVEIGERPAGIGAQEWFNRLSKHTGIGYQPLSGGRALIRLERVELESLRAKGAAEEE